MSTSELIYLIPGEDIEGYPGMSWCESSAPSDHCDPDDAIKYVRADIHESALKRQGNAELNEEIGHLEDRVISQGQQLREIVNITKGLPVNKMHSTHDAVESVERLQARVAMLDKTIIDIAAKSELAASMMDGDERGQNIAYAFLVLRDFATKKLERIRSEAGKAGG